MMAAVLQPRPTLPAPADSAGGQGEAGLGGGGGGGWGGGAAVITGGGGGTSATGGILGGSAPFCDWPVEVSSIERLV